MRKWVIFSLILIVAATGMTAAAESGAPRITFVPECFRPGAAMRISVSMPADGDVTLTVLDAAGDPVVVIADQLFAYAGTTHMSWDGMTPSGAAAPGAYTLRLEAGGALDECALTVGALSPSLTPVSLPDSNHITPGVTTGIAMTPNMAGTVTLRITGQDGETRVAMTAAVQEGAQTIEWDGRIDGAAVAPGIYVVAFSLTDESGYEGGRIQYTLTFLDEVIVGTSHIIKPTGAEDILVDDSYWNMSLGVMDESAIWDVMMQPMTVIYGEDDRDTYKLRLTPDSSSERSNIVGEITCNSQGVHVLETLDTGWTLIEAYNSSYGPSKSGYGLTGELIRGYVKTSLLQTKNPLTKYGLLLDKLTQRLYIFEDGKLISELLVSTGLATASRTWSETPAGEFFIISITGGFWAENLYCAHALRVNGGCLLHEVPCLLSGGDYDDASDRDYSTTEPKLGTKASHGCIRVQRKKNEDGINMVWIRNNIGVYTKVLIWEDKGRALPYTDGATPVFYNPNGGQYYHDDQNCSSVKSRYLPLTEFLYSQLDDSPYSKLKPCPYCNPPVRWQEIQKLNIANGVE